MSDAARAVGSKKPTGRSDCRPRPARGQRISPARVPSAAMCGRYVTVSSPTLLAERFHVTEVRPEELEPSYNVAPRADVPVVAESHGERVLDVVRWGLVPVVGQGSEDRRPHDQRPRRDAPHEQRVQAAVRAAPVHRPRRRLLRVAEDRRASSAKQPWFIRRRDGEPLAFAGLWEIWHDRSDGDDAPRVAHVHDHHDRRRTSCSRRSTTACRSCLPESEWDTWLDVENHDADDAARSCSCRCRPTSSRRGRSRRS